MDQDVTIKSLQEHNNLLQLKLKSYAKLGELYENAKAEVERLRNQTVAEHPEQGTVVSVSRPSAFTRSLSLKEVATSTKSDNSILDNLNNDYSITAPALLKMNTSDDQTIKNQSASIFETNAESLNSFQHVSSKPESLPEKMSETTLAAKLAAMAVEASKLEKQLAIKNAEMEKFVARTSIVSMKDHQIAALTEEVQKLKAKIGEKSGVEKNGVEKTLADDWMQISSNSNDTVNECGASKMNDELTETKAALEKKVAELTKTVSELKAANRSWEQHVKKISEENRKTCNMNLDEVEKLTQQLAEAKKQEEINVAECKQLVFTARKEAEEAETAKQSAVIELNAVRNQYDDLKTQMKHLQLEKKSIEKRAREMENIIAGQKEYINKLESRLMRESQMTSIQPQGAAAATADGHEISIPTEVMLLHQQIALWKEDFEKEREDREKAQSDLEKIRKISMEDRQLLHKERDVSRQRKDKLEQAEREKKDLISKLNSITVELQQLKRTLRTTPPLPAPKEWNCSKCTYMNNTSHRICRMCGNARFASSSSGLEGTVNTINREQETHRCHHRMSGLDQCDHCQLNDHLERDQSSRLQTD